jgi:hypothetical protein
VGVVGMNCVCGAKGAGKSYLEDLEVWTRHFERVLGLRLLNAVAFRTLVWKLSALEWSGVMMEMN